MMAGAEVGLDEDQEGWECRAASSAGQIARHLRISPRRNELVEAGKRQHDRGFHELGGLKPDRFRDRARRRAPLLAKPSASTPSSMIR